MSLEEEVTIIAGVCTPYIQSQQYSQLKRESIKESLRKALAFVEAIRNNLEVNAFRFVGHSSTCLCSLRKALNDYDKQEEGRQMVREMAEKSARRKEKK